METVEELILPPIRPLLSRCPALVVHADPYQGPFEAYHFLATESQTWDVAATLNVAAGRNGPILDLGCGRGRLTRALLAAGHQVTAVDTSAAALRHLPPAEGLTVVEGDALEPGVLPERAYGAVVVGDLSVNMFATEQALARLVRSVDRVLAPGGALSLPVLAPETAADYARMRGMTVVPYTGEDGVEQLMWIVMRFDPGGPYFQRTLFVQDTPDAHGRVCGHVTAVRERLWTVDAISPTLNAGGLAVAHREAVQDGAVEVLTVTRAAEGFPGVCHD